MTTCLRVCGKAKISTVKVTLGFLTALACRASSFRIDHIAKLTGNETNGSTVRLFAFANFTSCLWICGKPMFTPEVTEDRLTLRRTCTLAELTSCLWVYGKAILTGNLTEDRLTLRRFGTFAYFTTSSRISGKTMLTVTLAKDRLTLWRRVTFACSTPCDGIWHVAPFTEDGTNGAATLTCLTAIFIQGKAAGTKGWTTD